MVLLRLNETSDGAMLFKRDGDEQNIQEHCQLVFTRPNAACRAPFREAIKGMGSFHTFSARFLSGGFQIEAAKTVFCTGDTNVGFGRIAHQS